MAELKIKADSGGGTVSFKGPATTTSNAAVQLTLPVDDGTANQYLKTDGSGALSWASVGGATGTDYNDSVKVRLGTGNDLELYHDGLNSYLTHHNAGNFKIQSHNASVQIQTNGTESSANFEANGKVELFYDNVKKFETTSDGVKVTGSADADAHIYLYADEGDDNADKWRLISGSNGNFYLQKYTSGSWVHSVRAMGTEGVETFADYYGWGATVNNDGNATTRHGLRIITGSDDASGTNYAMRFDDGDGGAQGYITFTSGTVSYGAFTAHHPCIIPDSDNTSDSIANAYPYGTLLETISIEYKQKNGANTERGIIYKVQKTQSANSRKVLGAYGSSMNGGPEEQTNEHQALILGDGHIICNNAGGNIEIGDGICSSSTAGIGQKATVNPSMIIGIAQEAVTFTGSETKLVAVQYGLQQFIPWT